MSKSHVGHMRGRTAEMELSLGQANGRAIAIQRVIARVRTNGWVKVVVILTAKG